MKLSVADLIANKDAIKAGKGKTAAVFVSSLAGEITVKGIDADTFTEAFGMEDAYAADKHVVYRCVVAPDLKNSELQKTFNCVAPDDIVDALFLPGEVSKVAAACLALSGYAQDSVKLVDSAKNE